MADLAQTRGWRSARLRAPSTWVVLAFVGPGLVFFGIFFLGPIAAAMTNGFFEWSGTVRGRFSWVENFVALFSLEPYASQVGRALWHNLVFFIGTMFLQNGVGLILAFLLHRIRAGRRLFQTILSLPYLMSALVIGYAWGMLLSPQFGFVNGVLRAFGLPAPAWLGTPELVMPLLIIINAWQWVGVPMLIFGAGLAAIPEEQLEAARTDGAGPLRIARSVQLPQLIPSLSIVTVLTVIGTLNQFDLIYAIGGTAGGVGGAADMIGTLFYRVSFSNAPNAYGLSGAFSFMQLVLTLAVTIGTQAVFRRLHERYSS